MNSYGFFNLLIVKCSKNLFHRQSSSVIDDSIKLALSLFKFFSEIYDRLDITQVKNFFLNLSLQVLGIRKLSSDIILGLLKIIYRSTDHDYVCILLQEQFANVFS